jgi:hypothetical protein
MFLRYRATVMFIRAWLAGSPPARSLAHKLDQSESIDRGPYLGVIVKIHIDIAFSRWCARPSMAALRLPARRPGADPIGPSLKSFAAIAASIKFFAAVEADIDEISGGIHEKGPFHRIGSYQRDSMLSEQRDKFRRAKAIMPNFECMPDRTFFTPGKKTRCLNFWSWRWPSAAASSVVRGSIAKNSSRRFRSKLNCGGNCHRMGPSFVPRAKTPDAKKFASGVLAFFNRFI